MEKTQAMRALEGKRIPYEALSYPDDMRDALEIALLLNLPPAAVYKTLVVLPPEPGKKPLLVMIPSDAQLDLKKLAAAVGAKKIRMASQREAEELTGLQVGGISAVTLLNKGFTVYIDRAAVRLDRICVSAGKRGLATVAGGGRLDQTNRSAADRRRFRPLRFAANLRGLESPPSRRVAGPAIGRGCTSCAPPRSGPC
jgi:Cys-tRNA(Pro)/Cys-tRNA(Cys) deacylase